MTQSPPRFTQAVDIASATAANLGADAEFIGRHIGPRSNDIDRMLKVLGVASLTELIDRTVPAAIKMKQPLKIDTVKSEYTVLNNLKQIASKNQVFRSYIGMGYANCITPTVIQRNILENPGWYTQYTPYQPEISQGRLEALLNYQTVVMDLTGMAIANASLLDEGTAAAEAMSMSYGIQKTKFNTFWISEACHPQTIDVIKTRAIPLGIEVVIGDHRNVDFSQEIFGMLLQYPATDGAVYDYQDVIEAAHQAGAIVTVAADLLSLTLLKPPGEFGADIVVGNTQRFGIPLGYGGPHAAYFATKDAYKRQIPGRLVGVSKDKRGKTALRLALQTREQHIRRDKATSNICTAQVLLAIMAGMYAVYHGADGLKSIASRIHTLTTTLATGLTKLGYTLGNAPYFDTLQIQVTGKAQAILERAKSQQINLRSIDPHSIGISIDETTTPADVMDLWRIFAGDKAPDFTFSEIETSSSTSSIQTSTLARTSEYLTHPVFKNYHSETELLRYITRLQSKDLSLTHGMIPLGSCTMKLNATSEMVPVTWAEFGQIHPFAPVEQAQGYQVLFDDLERWLAEITGFDAISLQPNAGSQGEYAGLLVIREYHQQRGDVDRNVCLIPQSAHGTNPASAVMAGMQVVPIACD
ncbi:aminomethyl-transferring glycine dehydrogenase, partial [Chamaesiphon sp. VAR_69_metabat_338]|uniref:aminomethyl-transferring glycine dehydrogenase n=1 Tax=Chamaesiphon sp. VAR_69_metabat_338 TaxID=2964704 RepID=UPI00286E5BC7